MVSLFRCHIYHPTSTCKMGRFDDATTVVAPDCRVRGINNLRVVDASIMPEVCSGNTNIPTICIAERASDIIISGERITGVEEVASSQYPSFTSIPRDATESKAHTQLQQMSLHGIPLTTGNIERQSSS